MLQSSLTAKILGLHKTVTNKYKNKSNMKRATTALIKDLELQIDYLIGYADAGNHWKVEYHLREKLISDTLCSEMTPPEVIDKLNRIQESLWRLRTQENSEQRYLEAVEPVKKAERKIIVNDRQNDQSYFITI
jgi:hypothetical protein